VQAEIPVLIEHWIAGKEHQIHLVNYAGEPQLVRVELPEVVHGKVISPDHTPSNFNADNLELQVDVYSVLIYANS
jgi:hypothetical protein